MTGTNNTAHFFSRIDTFIASLSPGKNPMVLKTLAALSAVLFLGLDRFLGFFALHAAGMIFFLICLLLFFEGLLKSLMVMHKVSAELLIVSVMIVTYLDGRPLSGALVAWFISLGLYISLRIIAGNRKKLQALIKEKKHTARVLEKDSVIKKPVHEVRAGETLIIPKGEMIPVDSVITEGRSLIDESSITGEPFPVSRGEGDTITSGTVNTSAPLHARTVKSGNDSFLSVITREIEESLQKKSTLQKRADWIVQILLLSVTAYAFILYFITGDFSLTATALSIVCPCAWALATPTAFASAIGRLAGKDILAAGGEALENIHKADTLILDKTGTVTLAEPEVREVIAFDLDEPELLQIAASVESRFDHPIAGSIVRFAEKQGIKGLLPVKKCEDLPGRGVHAFIGNREVIIGSRDMLRENGIALPEVEYRGRAIWIARDSQVLGALIIQDIIKQEMKDLAGRIRALGIKKVILATGDNEEGEVRRVARIIGADEYHFNQKPEDKAALVRKRQENGRVIMVGDGVNDAPSLAAAHVGIAIGGNRNVNLAVKSSDMVILGPDAAEILTILKMSGLMKRVLVQDYTWAFLFNITGLALATMGMLTPVPAAVLHHISSVFVVSNAVRIYFSRI